MLFALALSGKAFGQNLSVTGTVTSTEGAPLSGVNVRVQGTDVRATTNAIGRYTITAPASAVRNLMHAREGAPRGQRSEEAGNIIEKC